MIIDFAFFLTLATFLSGIIALLDKLFFEKKRKERGVIKIPVIADYARSFFPVLLAVWLIRSFIVQPYRVPTGSLEPTIMPGDFIAVSEFSYGLRFPVWNQKIIAIGNPHRGDIALFRWPVKPSVIFVKRVIGLPGDHIVYKNKMLYINGQKIEQTFLDYAYDVEPGGYQFPVEVKEENLMGLKHKIYIRSVGGQTEDFDIKVPSDEYFMMGDNRDDSDDSRSWGFVPDRNLIGKAYVIWMSWNSDQPVYKAIQWHRIGKVIH
ncbi:MAG TPA: signal peptidase I [Coxiellaceae bacterium]|nr:signal peptidase I [Coxiellaceae bacterium]